ncbi:MAG: phosphoenolpyruvate-utilizing N-terminal domain-containing protein, partial [Phycisphaerae bacterium]
MEILRGIAVAPGVAIGEAVILEAEEYRIPYRSVPAEKVHAELHRLDEAFAKAISELND